MGTSWLGDAFKKLGQIYEDSWLRKTLGAGVDDATGLPESVGAVEGTFLGLSYDTWFLGLLILFVAAFLLTVGADLFKSSKAPQLPSNASQPTTSKPSISPAGGQDTSDLSPTSSDLDRLNEFPCEDCRSESSAHKTTANSSSKHRVPFDEGALQRARMQAISNGDMDAYNRLIQKHIEIYKQHGVDPCKSGFFPQGCEDQ
jgi:hypothetical protein